ncbi:aspergillopepsin-2 [Penicillium macrosclerotiorum]|uniref:aspergillopepsin-2 n=1 Tax=Penicillium macrosclerotiorum TaxID=303699 RepID=UPI0025471C31|nr:aspergillopepsin-2 [Penicillium macrosclerotiorum]KAJ5675787.1 aspergillopepsin-2 [Penicillium macrosclerotiorum]
MKFLTAILSSTLLASTAFAAPLTAQRQARTEARRLARSAERHSNPPYKPESNEVIHFNETSHVEYSSNWAGAVLVGSGYTAVTGQFTVPTPKVPSGSSSSGTYSASAWVGIDGDTWSDAILQTGVDFTISNGKVSYDAWYEWYPDYAYDFSGISISAGDVIKVTVTASSKSSGTATIENVTKGKTVSHTFTSSSVEGDLGEVNAEWIVEDFESGGSLVNFANFGTVTFTGAAATDNGSSVGPSGSTIIDIKQNNEVLTSVSTTSNSVTVSYV